jgi:hypothetical protein
MRKGVNGSTKVPSVLLFDSNGTDNAMVYHGKGMREYDNGF